MTSKPIVWHPAVLVRPTDNLLSSEMVRFKRFIPSYEREPNPIMAKIISHDYARIWRQERKQWANLCLPVTTKRASANILLLRKVVNPNLRRKQECPEKYRNKFELRRKQNFVTSVNAKPCSEIKK